MKELDDEQRWYILAESMSRVYHFTPDYIRTMSLKDLRAYMSIGSE